MKKKIALLAGVVAVAFAAIALAGCASDSDSDESAATTIEAAAPAVTDAPAATESSTVEADPSAEGVTPIVITAAGETITATLNDSQVSQDLIEMLPVTLPWFRNFGIEYITELDAPLTETGPFYTNVQPGDIVYYNPLDSITIIYAETGSVPTLTKMGEITSDLSVFRSLPNNVSMTITAG
jgi:hypothetical protein